MDEEQVYYFDTCERKKGFFFTVCLDSLSSWSHFLIVLGANQFPQCAIILFLHFPYAIAFASSTFLMVSPVDIDIFCLFSPYSTIISHIGGNGFYNK